MTQKHTNTPWVIRAEMPSDASDGTRWVIVQDQPYYDQPTRFIASMCGTMPTAEGESEANAQFIVRAVNAHERMVEALQTIADVWEEHPGDAIEADDILNPHFGNIRDVINAAIRAARGEA